MKSQSRANRLGRDLGLGLVWSMRVGGVVGVC